jgi:DNA-binding XRE family transcriptional regulator
MIRTEAEYNECLKRLKQDKDFISKQKKALVAEGLSKETVQRALQPSLSFHERMVEDVQWYERVKRRDFGALTQLTDLGQWLIALRIANAISQSELARRLGVKESQISRDEKNEYHGITLERAQRVLDALQEELEICVSEKRTRKRHRVL